MLIQSGLKHKKFLGLRLHTKAPSFHEQFGSTTVFPDCNKDAGMTNYNQNLPNDTFNTPAMPNGCTAMCTTDVMTDLNKVVYSPYYTYEQTCLEEGVPVGSELEMSFALNEPHTAGLKDLQGNITKGGTWYQVTPLNGSLFLGICSALTKGQSSVSFASEWYQSFDTPVNGVVPPPQGQTSEHNWKLCGIKTILGVQYLIGKPWLGSRWGEYGFCYFSQSIIDQIGGTAFTPMPSEGEVPVLVSNQTILEALINLLRSLLHLEQGSTESLYQMFEDDIALIEGEIFSYTHMPEETIQAQQELNQTAPEPQNAPVDTLLPWDMVNPLTHANYHNVRVICDQEGLSFYQKEVLTACVWQESEFMVNPTPNENKNDQGEVWSTDYGIVQVNDYFNIGAEKPFPSVEYVLANPEACVRWMANIYKTTGALQPWSSFTTGAYLAHMGKTL